MTREAAIAAAVSTLTSGRFQADLARRVAMPTVSREEAHWPDLQRYLDEELAPIFDRLGFDQRQFRRDPAPGGFLLATRIEDPALPTVLMYGHGDVVTGVPDMWSPGLTPFQMIERDGVWYGRGTGLCRKPVVNLGCGMRFLHFGELADVQWPSLRPISNPAVRTLVSGLQSQPT